MSVSINKFDFNLICRTCLEKKSNLTSVHSRPVLKMIHSFTKVKIRKNDGLPTSICTECQESIQRSYYFKTLCENSDKILRKVLRIKKPIEPSAENIEELPIKIEPKLEDALDKNEPEDNCIESTDCSNVCNGDMDSDSSSSAGAENKFDPDSDFIEPDDPPPILNDKDDSDEEKPSEVECKSNDECAVDLEPKSTRNGPSVTSVRVEKAKLMGPDKCDPSTLTCKICNKVLVNIYSLGRHMEMHDENRKFRHACGICKKGFYEKGQLTKHLRRHRGETRYTCELCSKAFYELSALAVHMKKHKVKPMCCEVCGKPFYVRLQLEIHTKTHSTEKEHVCNRCGKAFAKAKQLRKHGLAHVEERTYACLSCDKAFKDEYNLRIHVRRVHVDEPKLDVCNVCGKAVKHIKHHMLRHSDARPHSCPHCTRAFACKSQLRNHCRAKHGDGTGDLGAYTVLCAACGKRCQSTTELRVHMRKHTGERPYACHLCDKRYKTGYLLTAHVRSHTGERPYVCSVCHKGFYTNQILKHHARIHTGERPYECRVCGRAFTQNSALRTHMKIH